MSRITELNTKFHQYRGRQQALLEQLEQANARIATYEQRASAAKRSELLVQEAATRTQRRLEYRISHVVTLALRAVFKEAYEFKIEFVKRRGRTECELWLVKNGQQCDPLMQTGGGVCDVTSFALRIGLLTIRGGRKVLVLDEPFRNLHGKGKQKRTSAMVKMLSDRLDMQIIMVSDVEEINSAADRVFRFSLDSDGATKCEVQNANDA